MNDLKDLLINDSENESGIYSYFKEDFDCDRDESFFFEEYTEQKYITQDGLKEIW